MWWRSFFLQSAWSYEFKQNLGFATFFASLAPREERAAEPGLLESFNTNPVTSCFVVPFLKSQERGYPGLDELLRARAFLSSSFAATGDRLLWFLLRPLAGLAGAAVLWLSGNPWLSAAVLLLVYNVPQLGLRALLWRRGLAGGAPSAEVQRISRWSERARRAGLMLSGALLVAVPARGTGWGPVGVVMLALALGLSGLVLRWRPRAATLLGLVFLVAGIAFNHGLR